MPHHDSPVLPSRTLTGALQGLTLLAVEDSRYAGEALRLMAQRSGARLRRAESLSDAQRHLRLYRPDLVLVDIGLPDGSGLQLIEEIRARPDRPPPVLAMSGDPACREAALAAGAALFMEKPWPGLARFQSDILRVLPGMRGAMAPDLPLRPDRLALSEDLARAVEMLDSGTDSGGRHYLAQFLGGIARQIHDRGLAHAAAELQRGEAGSAGALAQLLRCRLEEQPRPFV